MSFLIRNKTSGPAVDVEIKDLGITVKVGVDFDLTKEDPGKIANSGNLLAAIATGDIVVIDPLDGITELSLGDSVATKNAANDPHWRLGAGSRINDLSDVDVSGASLGDVLTLGGSGSWDDTDPSALAANQDIWETISADTGSTTANTTTDTLTIAGAGVISTSITGDTLTISDSGQDLFDTITPDSGGDVVADSPTDTLTLTGGTGITTVGTPASDTITITNTSPNVDQNIWETIAADTGSTVASTTFDTLIVAGGTDISTSISGDTVTISFTGTGSQNLFETFVPDSGGNIVADIPADTLTLAGGTSISTVGTPASDTITLNVDDDFLRNTGDTLDSGTLTIASGATFSVATGATATVADQPISATDIANKAYVDSLSAGLDPKESVRVATTVILDSVGNGTWTEAGAGVGATLTAGTAGTTTIDVVLLANGNRVLVKNENGGGVNLDGTNNGIYTVSAADAGSQTVLTRATDQDGSPANEVSGGNFTFVEQGTANSGDGFVVVFDGNLVVDTDVMTWTQFSDGGAFVYGTITGDAGTATAASSNDTLNFTGIGITTAAAEGAPDTVTFTLDIADLSAGVGPLVLADEVGVNDSGTTLRFTFTDVVEDLDIPNAITANGLVTRTAADTYASRTITASANEDELGITITNGDGVAGNPTIGLDIDGTTSSPANLASTDEFLVHDKSEGTGGANRSMTGLQIADGANTLAGPDLWETISSDSGSTVANIRTDTLTIAGGTGISTAIAGDTVTITNTAPNVDQDIWETISADTGSTTANTTTDTLTVAGGTDISTTIVGDTLTIDFTGTGSQNLFETFTPDSGGDIVADTTTDTLTLTGGTGITTVGTPGSDTITINPANDLAAVEALSTTGLATRTALETWTTRTITASANEDELGITITNGDGVSGNPTIGLDIDGTTSSPANMAGTDEFLTHDKSEGTGGANRSMTGLQIADGANTLAGPDLWETISSDSGSTTANTRTDTLTVAGAGTVSTAIVGDTLTITGAAGAGQDLFETFTGDTGSAVADSPTDTLALIGATNGGITTIASSTPDQVTFSITPIDLTTGAATLALGDFIIVNDSADTATTIALKYTFTNVVQDLDIPNAITVNGLVTRTAADTYASRTITASANEDELGIAITNGDGVSGNPTVGLDIVGLTDPAADLASTDEFAIHDKSEGTGGANRKITGQNVSDGVMTIAGLGGLAVTTILGQEILTLVDTTRANKVLSVAELGVLWSDTALAPNEFLELSEANDANAGFSVPLTATLVRASSVTSDNNGNDRDIDLYVNGTLNTASIITFTGSPSGQEEDRDVTLNIDLAAGDIVHLRGDADSGLIDDVNVVLFFKWRG